MTPRPALAQYTNLVFSDGFESGNFSNWAGGTQGTGTASVQTVAAHSGTYGGRIATLETQYAYFSTALASPRPGQPDHVLDPHRQRLTRRDRRAGA